MTTLTDYMTESEEQLMHLAIETMEDCLDTIKRLLERVKDRTEQELRLIQLAKDLENDSR